MKHFVFRLEKVLGYRAHREEIARMDLFRAVDDQRRRQRAVVCLEEKRDEITDSCFHEGVNGIAVSRYHLYQNFLNKLDHDLQESAIGLKEADCRVKAQETKLAKETINRKALERLKALQEQSWFEAEEKAEQKALDEMIIVARGQRT